MFNLTDDSTSFEGTDKATIDKVIKLMEEGGYVVRTKEFDDKKFTEEVQEGINKVTAERALRTEQEIEELTGVKKGPNEKYYDHYKRAIGQLNDNISDATKKIEQYEKEGVEGNKVAEEYKSQLETLKANAKKEREELEGKVKSLEEGAFTSRANSHLSEAMAEIKVGLKKGENEAQQAVIDDAIENRIRKFQAQYTPFEFEGMIAYKDEKGETVLDKTEGNSKSAKSLLSPLFEDLKDTKRVQGGTGAEGGGSGEGESKIKVPSNIKSQQGLNSYLQNQKGLDPNSAEFAKAFEEGKIRDGKPLPIREASVQ